MINPNKRSKEDPVKRRRLDAIKEARKMKLQVLASRNVYKYISIYGFKTEMEARRFACQYGGKAYHFENCKPLSNANSVEFDEVNNNDTEE